jgi:hypothetical protein
MYKSRRGFLGALGGLAGVAAAATLSPATAAIVKAGEKYGGDIFSDAQKFLSTPLRTMTAHQVTAVDRNTVVRGSKAHLDAMYKLIYATHEEKMQTLCLLTWRDETFEGPLVTSYTEEDDPYRMNCSFEYECDRAFQYDGVQIVTFEGIALPHASFSMPPSVDPGDTLKVNWTLSV